MKTISLCIECEESVNVNEVVARAMKLLNPTKGIIGFSIVDQSMVDLNREKRLDEYFEQVDYNLNCLKDKLYKIRKEVK